MRVARAVALTDEEWRTLEKWSRGRSTPVRLMERAQMLLMASQGMENQAIAEAVGTDSHTVARWRGRFLQAGLAGVEKDAPRSGRKPTLRNRVAQKDRRANHANDARKRHPLERADAGGGNGFEPLDGASRLEGQRPQAASDRTFKLSNDPHFVEKVLDVVGLYLNPPEHALVLSWTRRARFRRWTARSRACRSIRAAAAR